MADDDANGLAGDDAALATQDAPDTDDAEAKTPDPDAEAPDTEADASAEDGDADEDTEDDGDDEGDDEVELNFGGKTVRFNAKQTAKEVAEEMQSFADQTWRAHMQRSEEVAEKRKALESQAETLEKVQTYDDEAFKLYAAAKTYGDQAAQLRQQLAKFDYQSNPDQYRLMSDRAQQMEQAANQASQALTQREQAAEQERTKLIAQKHESGVAEIKRQVRDFDAEKVIEYAAKQYGVDKDKAKKTYGLDPKVAIMAHKAMKWDEMQARASKKSPPPKAEPVKARQRKSGPAVRTPENMSIEQFHKMRVEQRQKRAGTPVR